jgi:hypothetical protein
MSEDNRQQNPDEIVLENVKLFHAEQMNENHSGSGVTQKTTKSIT